MTEFAAQGDGRTVEAGQIRDLIPHRYPMLLVDRVVDVRLGDRAVGIKNVTINEPFFPGHFPGQPVMPGVLIIEAMAQTAAVLVSLSMGDEAKDKLVYFMTITDARFRKPVVPGDVLHLEIVKERSRHRVWKFKGTAKVAGQVVTQAGFSAMMVDRQPAAT